VEKKLKNRLVKLNAISIFVALISLSGYISSCNKESIDGELDMLDFELSSRVPKEGSYSSIDDGDWRKQLKKIIDSPPSILAESNIKLLEYKVIGRVNNTEDEIRFRDAIASNANMFPIYSKGYKTIRAVSKKEAIDQHSEHQKFTEEQGNDFLGRLNLHGTEILNLKWNNNGVESNTICAVSDKEGILYDNLITNTFIIGDPIISSTSSLNQGPVTHQWEERSEAFWLWGSQRGECKIKHSATYNDNHFLSHSFSASHYISLGNSDAQVSEVSNGVIAYGYGMSTPFITITLTYTAGNYTLTFSTMLGSTMGGTGQHSF